jgi:L-methionine (R)-S-oxide reductase
MTDRNTDNNTSSSNPAGLLAAAERIVANAAAATAAGAPDRDAALRAVCELLHEAAAHYDWVGFYLADQAARTLTLGPFVGEPTEHVRIPYGRGVCGQAAQSGRTVLVQDVRREGNYLACSPYVRSEIVVPVVKDGRFVAELDIDSHVLSPFTPAEVAMLEQVAAAVARLF